MSTFIDLPTYISAFFEIVRKYVELISELGARDARGELSDAQSKALLSKYQQQYKARLMDLEKLNPYKQ